MCMIESIRYIKWCSLQPSWLRECKVGLKKRSIKGGKWKELVLKMGFDHHSLSLTLPSIMLYFYGKSEEARIIFIIVCAAVSTKRKLDALLSLNLEWPSGWLDICLLTVLPTRRFWIIFLHGLSSFTFYFCSKLAFSFHTSPFRKVFVLFKMTGNKFYCLFQFGKYCNVFYWL